MKPRNGEATRNATLGRMARLIGELLDGTRHDRYSAAKSLETTPAQAARYLAAIEQNLTQVKTQRDGRTQKFYAEALSSRPPPQRAAAIAACFASSVGRLLDRSKYGVAVQEARKYVLEALPEESSFRDIDRKFLFLRRGGEPAIERRPECLDALVDALLDSREVEIEYENFEAEVKRRVVKPLSIAVYEHQIYLIAMTGKPQPTVYRLARIRQVTVRQEPFDYPTSSAYDPDALFRSQFGIIVDEAQPVVKVVVKLAPRWRSYVDGHRWHMSQRVASGDEGVVVTFDVRVCAELKRWILGFGPEAEVLEPTVLRATIAEATRRAASIYDKANDSREGRRPKPRGDRRLAPAAGKKPAATGRPGTRGVPAKAEKKVASSAARRKGQVSARTVPNVRGHKKR